MRQHKLTSRQRLAVLHAWQAGHPASELCKTYGISRATLYSWKQAYTGMSAEAIQQWDALARDHAVLRRQMAQQQADRTALQAMLQVLELTIEQKRTLVRWARAQRLSSISRACQLLRLSRSQFSFDEAYNPYAQRQNSSTCARGLAMQSPALS